MSEALKGQVEAWASLFKKLGMEVPANKKGASLVIGGRKGVYLPPRPEKDMQLVIVPQSVGIDQLCELFKASLNKYGVAGAIAPVIRGEAGSKVSTTIQLSDMIAHNDRCSELVTYAYWFKRHIVIDDAGAAFARSFDSRMTLAEAFWYHLLLIEEYGEKYFDLNYADWQECRGTRRRSQTGRESYAALRWDIQDIKVCLDWCD